MINPGIDPTRIALIIGKFIILNVLLYLKIGGF